jgi:hypothetical protein
MHLPATAASGRRADPRLQGRGRGRTLMTQTQESPVADFQKEYTDKAFAAVKPYLWLLPTDVQRAFLLGESVIASHGAATVQELEAEFGKKWCIAKRTKAIVAKYGPEVRCLTPEQFEAGQRRAIEKRNPSTSAKKSLFAVVELEVARG